MSLIRYPGPVRAEKEDTKALKTVLPCESAWKLRYASVSFRIRDAIVSEVRASLLSVATCTIFLKAWFVPYLSRVKAKTCATVRPEIGEWKRMLETHGISL